MRKPISLFFLVVAAAALLSPATSSEDLTGMVKKAVEKATLDQPGTKPFHLKATYASSYERDRDTNRNGTIEYWWESPSRWRRELSSPDFHQIEVVDGDHRWQHNDGDFFPEWLRELAVAIVRPVPIAEDELLVRVKSADVKHLRLPTKVNGQIATTDQINLNWSPTSQFPDEEANGSGYLALTDDRLFYAGGPGWSGLYHEFKDFHGRLIARKVGSGSPEVTATVTTLEDLRGNLADVFSTNSPGGDPKPIDTLVLGESDFRKNVISGGDSFIWPATTDAPFEGTVWMKLVLDRTGRIRDIYSRVSENPKMTDAAEKGFRTMTFRPFLKDGEAMQAVGTVSVHFKAARPDGSENFDTAHNYFEDARKLNFLAAAATGPYKLTAEFQLGTPSGIQTGRYEDTWLSETQWKREAWLGSSHLVRSQDGEQHYRLSEGSDAGILAAVLLFIEPIPAADTMSEGDWRISRDTANGLNLIRVFRGNEGPNGEPVPEKSQGYWFDDGRHLVKSYVQGYEVRPAKIEMFEGIGVPRQIDVLKDDKLAMQISVQQIGAPDADAAKHLALKGHEWERAFTAEVR
jgi:hypothetical protein